MDTKTCKHCGQTKPVAEFQKRAASADGLQHWCRVCNYAAQQDWKKRNHDKIRGQRKRSAIKRREKYATDGEHREAVKAQVRAYRQSLSVEERQRRDRAGMLRQQYGLTVEQFEEMRQLQDGKCPLCLRTPKVLAVDHDHETGKVRGLLCKSCNRALGCFGDNLDGLMRVVRYLRGS